MPKVTIDGKEIEVPAKTRIIEAAKMMGTDVPYYCYHPGLSIAGNCRMCLVEIEKMPKLQISCQMEVQEGMVIRTNTEKVLQTRQHVLEFLLVNHPVDCPVCDQAGECWLQDYYMRHGLHDSRLDEDKIKKPKAVPLGPTVMLDAERCILCSRCVRFTDEISKTSELGIVNRGDHAEVQVFPGKELNNPYSGNVVDICPVGALTDRDFRFKIRVWYLKTEDSICNGCSRGCNIQVQYNLDRPHHGKGRVKRLKPRFNEEVNKWWMCDEGRYGYKFHDENRILKPIKRVPGKFEELEWYDILPEIANRVTSAQGKVGVFLSPQLSNESFFLAKNFFSEKLKLKNLFLLSPNAEGFQDDLLIRADKNPNSKGAKEIGVDYNEQAVNDFLLACEKGEIKGAIIFGQDLFARLDDQKVKKIFQKLEWTVFIGSNHNLTSEYAGYVLPSATYVEDEGTFTNFEGRVQKFNKVLEPLAESQPIWRILIHLARAMNTHLHYDKPEEIFNELALNVKFFQGVNYSQLKTGGADIRDMAAPTVPVLEQNADILTYFKS